jgi:CHAT domain-containing protein
VRQFIRSASVAVALIAIGGSSAWTAHGQTADGAPTPKPDRSQLEAQFAKTDAERKEAAANTQERAEAARKAMQAASDLAWLEFDAGRYAEASNWFARSAERKKDHAAHSRGYWEEYLRTEVPKLEGQFGDRIAEWHAKLEAAPEAEKQGMLAAIDALEKMRYIMRYNAITMLQGIARDTYDSTASLRYAEDELAVRRLEMAYLESSGAATKDKDLKTVEIATAIEHVASAQSYLAQFDDAEKNYLQALSLRRALPENLPQRKVESTLASLGWMYLHHVGDYAKAREYYQQAVDSIEATAELREKALAEDPYPAELKAHMSAEQLAKHEAGRAETREMTIALDALTYARALSELGGAIHEAGDLRTAQSYYEKALEVGESLPKRETVGILDLIRANIRARGLSDLAQLHAASGEMELASKQLDEAVTIKRSIGADESTANALLQLADMSFGKGEFQNARNSVEQARQIFAAAQNLKNVVSATRFLAVIAREENDMDEAAKRAEEALLLARKTANPTLVSSCARAFASVRLRQKKLGAAKALIEEARAADAKTGSVSDRIATLGITGEILEAEGANDKALVPFEEAVKLVESIRATAASETAFADVKENYRPYERIVRVLIKLGRTKDAFDYLNRAKSKKLQDMMPASSLISDDKREQEALEKAAALEAKQRAAEAQLATEQAKPAPDETAIKNLKMIAASTQGEYRELVEDIKDKNPEWEKSMTVKPLQLVETQEQIPDGVTFLQYAPLGEQLYVFVVTNQTVKIYTPEVKPEELKKKILAVRKQITSGESGGPLTKNLCALYEMLIGPIEAELASVKTIAFIPNQILFYLPLPALAKKQPDGSIRYLIEDKEIVYLTAADVMRAVQPPPSGKSKVGMVAFGNPTGAELPAAELEVNSIAGVFPGTDVFSGDTFTKAAVTNESMFDKRIVHFATHGRLNAAVPKESYLQLAAGGAPGAEKLTVKEIWSLPMKKVDIVTLSACETALGDKEPDGGEITTLAEAFATAKVRTVVASLWSVGDESTKTFMVAFYTRLAGGASKPAALRGAQLELMKNPRYTRPLYWAPFVLMGDWR